MARQWSSGFEMNALSIEFDSAVGAAASVVTSPIRSGGSYAMRVAGLSSGARSGVFKGAIANLCFHRIYFRVDTLPSAENTIIALGTSVSAHTYRLKLTSTGTLKLYDVDGTTVIGTSAALSTGVWYKIRLGITAVASTDTLNAYIDGTQFVTNGTGNAGTTSGIAYGGNLNNEAQTTGDWFFDDLAANDSTGSNETSWPGDGTICHLRPSGTGDFAEGASGTGGAGWDDVDEVTPDDATSYWELQTDSSAGSGNADRLDVACQNMPAGGTPILVQVGARVKPASNANCSYVCRIKSQASGTVVEGATKTITGTAWVTHDDTANAKLYSLTRYTDPQAGGAWTEALINAMQIGIRAPDGNPNVQVTALWALLEYTPAVGGGGTTPAFVFAW